MTAGSQQGKSFMNKRILITGINGLLGQNLVQEFLADHDIFGIDLMGSVFDPRDQVSVSQLDMTDTPALEALLQQTAPDYVVHGAAFTNVDGAEDHQYLAFKVNRDVPASLARICKDQGIPLIHISTDYVFNGEAGPYRENAPCDPRGIYSRSKHAGERAVLDSGARCAVIRPNVLYGHGKALKSSFVTWLIAELMDQRPVRIVNDQFNNPTYARRLAAVVRTILEREAWDIWHFGSKEVLSRYDFALKIADTFGLSSHLIHAISTVDLNQKAPRPMRSGLISEKIHEELGISILSVQEELMLLKEEMNVS